MSIKVAKFSELEENTPMTINVSEQLRVVLVKKGNRVFALNDACPHMGGPMGEGEVEDNEIVCPWHLYRFNIEDGKCLDGGCENLSTYPLFIEDDDIYLELDKA